MQNLASHYKSKSTVALQGTLELFDREIDPSWAYPVWAIALDPTAAAELFGPDVADALQRGQVVLNKSAAKLRKADAGTSITLAGWDDPIKSLSTPVGMVVDDQRTGDAEMLISVKTAHSLGLQRMWRVVVWGGDVRAVARDAASTVGAKYIDRSWTPKSVDSVLPPAQAEDCAWRVCDPPANGARPVNLRRPSGKRSVVGEAQHRDGRDSNHRSHQLSPRHHQTVASGVRRDRAGRSCTVD